MSGISVADSNGLSISYDRYPKPGEDDFGDEFIDKHAQDISQVEDKFSLDERNIALAQALVLCAGCKIELCTDDCTNKKTRGVLVAAGASVNFLPIVFES